MYINKAQNWTDRSEERKSNSLFLRICFRRCRSRNPCPSPEPLVRTKLPAINSRRASILGPSRERRATPELLVPIRTPIPKNWKKKFHKSKHRNEIIYESKKIKYICICGWEPTHVAGVRRETRETSIDDTRLAERNVDREIQSVCERTRRGYIRCWRHCICKKKKYLRVWEKEIKKRNGRIFFTNCPVISNTAKSLKSIIICANFKCVFPILQIWVWNSFGVAFGGNTII